MKPSPRSFTFAVFAFAALLQLPPLPAQASGALSFDIDGGEVVEALLAGNAVIFGLIDIAFIAGGRPMPMWLSIVQVSWAGMLVPALAAVNGDSVLTTIGAAASATWFSTHGIYDMVHYPAYRREKLRQRELERERERERRRLRVTLEPRAQGAMVRFYAAL